MLDIHITTNIAVGVERPIRQTSHMIGTVSVFQSVSKHITELIKSTLPQQLQVLPGLAAMPGGVSNARIEVIMGDDPNSDEDIAIVNPTFALEADWDFNVPWTENSPFAHFDAPGLPINALTQHDLPFVPGNLYVLTFTMSNTAIVNPAAGFSVQLGGVLSFGLFRADGDYSIEIMTDSVNDTLAFIPNAACADGAIWDIDEPVLTPLGSNLTDLGINWPEDRKSEFQAAAAADYMQIIASRNGGTHARILFNYP